MNRMTLDFVRFTQSSVIQIIHHNAGLKCCLFYLPKCSFVIIVIYVYFTYISQGSVETHLWCGEIYNNNMIVNCPQSVPVKKILKIGL